jgi:hypothetical protein
VAVAGARCGDGSSERRSLENDPSDVVRAAAALAVARNAKPEDKRALERCATSDRSGAVALRCRTPPAPPQATHAVTVYPVSEGQTTPRPHAAFALALSDGTTHLGTCDRRGASIDPAAPEGELALVRAGIR